MRYKEMLKGAGAVFTTMLILGSTVMIIAMVVMIIIKFGIMLFGGELF